LFNLNRDV